MKVEHKKKVSKTMKYFELNFGFRRPYNMLVDGTICNKACDKDKLFRGNLSEALKTHFSNEVKIVTTGCCITELEEIGMRWVFHATNILKSFQLFRCDHKRAVSAGECIKSMVADGNPHHLIIASQDHNLRTELRNIPGVPLVYLYGNAPVLEKPSRMTESFTERLADGKTDLSNHQLKIIQELKKKTFGEEVEDGPKRKKRKGPRGANPLSCLKSKKKTDKIQKVNQDNKIKKKRRKKNKKSSQNVEN